MRIGKFPRVAFSSAVSLLALGIAVPPAFARIAPRTIGQHPASTKESIQSELVTTRRKPDLLRGVLVSVTALIGGVLAAKQINMALDLPLSIPNVTFTESQFASKCTARGLRDLSVNTFCDSATTVHVNNRPMMRSCVSRLNYSTGYSSQFCGGPESRYYIFGSSQVHRPLST